MSFDAECSCLVASVGRDEGSGTHIRPVVARSRAHSQDLPPGFETLSANALPASTYSQLLNQPRNQPLGSGIMPTLDLSQAVSSHAPAQVSQASDLPAGFRALPEHGLQQAESSQQVASLHASRLAQSGRSFSAALVEDERQYQQQQVRAMMKAADQSIEMLDCICRLVTVCFACRTPGILV